MSASEYAAPVRWRAGEPPWARVRAIPTEVWALWVVLALATAIRVLTIDNQSYWTDEALTAYEAHLPFGAMINTVAHVETTPPLYFVLAWIWAHLFGTGEVALRSISTIAGVAVAGLAYLATRELISRWAGVLAAALVAVNPFMVWYSQEARSYMLLAALTAASLVYFLKGLNEPSRGALIRWAGVSSLALMTHFFAGFLIAPEALWLLWRARSRAALLAVGTVGAVQLGMLPLAVTDTNHGAGWIAAIGRAQRVGHLPLEWALSLLMRRATLFAGFAGGGALLLIVTILIAVGASPELRRRALVVGSLVAFVLVVPLALALVGQDYFLTRNETPAFVPLVVLIAAACTLPRTRAAGGVLAVLLLATFAVATAVVQTTARYHRPDWRAVASSLGPATVPRAILAADGITADPLKIYLPGVSWVQPKRRRIWIDEIDVIGVRKTLALQQNAHLLAASVTAPVLRGPAVPRADAPAGARLISRRSVQQWIVARFALRHPIRVSIQRLAALAPRYFRRVPEALLVFTQPRMR